MTPGVSYFLVQRVVGYSIGYKAALIHEEVGRDARGPYVSTEAATLSGLFFHRDGDPRRTLFFHRDGDPPRTLFFHRDGDPPRTLFFRRDGDPPQILSIDWGSGHDGP